MKAADEAIGVIESEVIGCASCPRLVAWREQVGREKRAAFADEEYWARPVHGIGDHAAPILVVGLAPAAHGANRTGRMFTGDRSGDFLFESLHRTGFANQPTSERRGDGLELTGLYITSAVKCAPPENRPTAEEQRTCGRWLIGELSALVALTVIVALGGLAFDRVLRLAGDVGWESPRPRPKFGHGVTCHLEGGPVLLGAYHPSQQNTFTGRLTPQMLDDVFLRARSIGFARKSTDCG